MRSGRSSRSLALGQDELRDHMQVGARVDVVRDARRDDREDVRGPLTADVEPGEQPVPSAEDQSSELALAAIMPRSGLCRVGAEQSDAVASEARALALDGHVLEVLVAERLDEQLVAEPAALDNSPAASGRRRPCHPSGTRRARRGAPRRRPWPESRWGSRSASGRPWSSRRRIAGRYAAPPARR